jgi:hypothetical protein
MEQNEQVYVKLQKHLDNQAIGYPATRSGVEIKILKFIFTPDEAEIACCLSYKFEPLKTIFSRAGHLVDSPEELEKCLERIQKKGGIESKIKNGIMHYCNAPLIVGMYEFQLERLTPEFVKDCNEYTSGKDFGVAFLGTKLPQMRTIPVAKSIHPQHNVSTYDEVATLMQEAEDPFVIFECICRKKKSMEGQPCKKTDRKETCLAVGDMGRMAQQSGQVDHRKESETGIGASAVQYGKGRVHLFMLRMLLWDVKRSKRPAQTIGFLGIKLSGGSGQANMRRMWCL